MRGDTMWAARGVIPRTVCFTIAREGGREGRGRSSVGNVTYRAVTSAAMSSSNRMPTQIANAAGTLCGRIFDRGAPNQPQMMPT